MMYEFIQNREPPSSEEEEDVPEEEKPLGPDEDGADTAFWESHLILFSIKKEKDQITKTCSGQT